MEAACTPCIHAPAHTKLVLRARSAPLPPLPPLVPSRMDSQAWLVSLVAGVGLLRYARGAAAAAPASTSAPIVVVGTKNKCKLAAVRASLARYEQSEEKR